MSTGTTDWTGPMAWGDNVSSPADFSSEVTGWRGALVRSWVGTSPDMDMPPLDHHVVVLHGGGPKRLTRQRDGGSRTVDAPIGAVSVIPAGSGHVWSTEGPIEFTHVYLDPKRLERAVIEVFDRNPHVVSLCDRLGSDEPLLADLCRALRSELEREGDLSPLYLDALLDSFILTLLRRCSTLGEVSTRAPWVISPRRLKRVLDYVEAELARAITLDDLAETAGMSRFHFSRVFRQETGCSPYAYLLTRRVERAKIMLRETTASLTEVSASTGFSSKSRLSATFRKLTGRSPAQFRREH